MLRLSPYLGAAWQPKPPLLIGYRDREMQGEELLWLTVVLLALAEQDERNISKSYGGQRVEAIAEQARRFCASADFDGCCRAAGVAPHLFRSLTPEKAMLALEWLRKGAPLENENSGLARLQDADAD